MDENDYERVIRELCHGAGIEPWEEVARARHIESDGRTIGLIPDAVHGGLSVYIDLGPLFAQRDPAVHERLLVANLERRGPLAGAFCVHPHTGHAVYHLPLPRQVTGAELSGILTDAVERIAARFEALLHPAA